MPKLAVLSGLTLALLMSTAEAAGSPLASGPSGFT